MQQSQHLIEEPAVGILVVEDEPLVRLILTEILSEAGYRVIEAANADEALLLLDARPDTRLMITDVRMPGSLDGFALARLAVRRWPGIGVIVTSGHALPDEGDLPARAAFLSKPWQPAALIEQVQRQLAETGAGSSDEVEAAAVHPE